MATYYIDYVSGSNAANGTTSGTPWKHCPGDPQATGNSSAKTPAAGDFFLFNGGITYQLLGATGILLSWSGTSGNPITYGTYGSGNAILTDNYGANGIAALDGGASRRSYITLQAITIQNVGGSSVLPTDTGSAIAQRPGYGITFGGGATGVSVNLCTINGLGYVFNQKPMDANSVSSEGILLRNPSNVTVNACSFTRCYFAIDVLANSGSIDTVSITNCSFTSYVKTCIDFGQESTGCSMDNVTVSGCSFFDYYEWDASYWTGYGDWPHTEGIFLRSDYGSCTWGSSINFHHNTFYAHVGGGGTASIYITEGTSCNVYRNTFLYQGKGEGIKINNGPRSGASAQTVRILNNTFLDTFTLELSFSAPTSALGTITVKNNIWYDTQTGSGANYILYSDVASLSGVTFDYNCYKSFNTNSAQFFQWTGGLGSIGLSGMQGNGWEAHGLATDPLFNTLTNNATTCDPSLQAGSPCIHAGQDLTSLSLPSLDVGYNGVTAPAGQWDMGAYQRSASSGTGLFRLTGSPRFSGTFSLR